MTVGFFTTGPSHLSPPKQNPGNQATGYAGSATLGPHRGGDYPVRSTAAVPQEEMPTPVFLS